ncbi:Ribonuclease BN [Aliiroseovarius sp. xm-m-379]|uniref:MBL fold metallo-hydrolase n=1 Tax=unclassified Aliiroseovarius TaxID=2623558 RepID=UPI001568A6C4|nr:MULTISPECIES: MBL fold metallo-hydrolase [unclassified Aliiroseovarius]NRP11980.1 Ribonuclease BN [Aliiroseovarius sp. xm-d-517]NRP25203.1 Ribonuclease BN [Aliiroseovarius sp. xm-m-379]NRP31065.1 Ribonuclease BN [Aliiroseovarius sp. xm-m-314]NRP34002.1 Ribonuclease BN [Aliiroseovarius sp. xm-a-104]NRP41526.1 Ribonuclease BN [Aliiroseovarius sp. xm-m-339-2]
MSGYSFTILGCGSSGGVPRIGGLWGECDPNNPKNIRSRCSALVTRTGEDGGVTRILIDTSPDMRHQLLTAGVGEVDAVVYTHSHADHMHGIDDLRMVVYNMRKRVQVWADGPTQNDLMSRFGYAFVQPKGSSYPPILDLNTIDGDVVIEGAGGAIRMTPFEVTHGNIDALGFRIGKLAYLPDVSEIPEAARPALQDLDIFIIDALRRTPHPTHFNLDDALLWISRVGARKGVLTNMHIDLDHATVEAETPDHVVAAYDGMVIPFEA